MELNAVHRPPVASERAVAIRGFAGKARRCAAAVAAALVLATILRAQSAGGALPAWTPGTLDIHQINTGRGNAAFLMLPDGTTMLVDAGDGGNLPPRGTPPRPDASRTPGEWIARYARAMGADAIDYGFLTHFHADHMNALVDVAGRVPIRTMLDRAWPEYGYPSRAHAEFQSAAFVQYRELLQNGGVKAARFEPGRDDQIVLVRAPAKYPGFRVRNIAANGEVWTGAGRAAARHFPPLDGVPQDDWPTENMCSQSIRITYGTFDYYTGGDIPGRPRPGYPEWHDVETPVARAVGPVDAAVVNHHGNRDSTTAFFVATLRPRVWILPVWSADHRPRRAGSDVLDAPLSGPARRLRHQHDRGQPDRHRPAAGSPGQRAGPHPDPRRAGRRELPGDRARRCRRDVPRYQGGRAVPGLTHSRAGEFTSPLFPLRLRLEPSAWPGRRPPAWLAAT
jgi:beta-lactamase superfamily II metal-dependent hydrolase